MATALSKPAKQFLSLSSNIMHRAVIGLLLSSKRRGVESAVPQIIGNVKNERFLRCAGLDCKRHTETGSCQCSQGTARALVPAELYMDPGFGQQGEGMVHNLAR
jgi:hypothetical protein